MDLITEKRRYNSSMEQKNTGSVPAATNSRLSPLPPEPAGFNYDRGATIDIPLDSGKTKLYLAAALEHVADTTQVRCYLDNLGIKVNYKVRKQLTCSWMKPKMDFVCLNTDEIVEGQFCGSGSIVRSYEGHVLCCFSGSAGRANVLMQELLGINEVLKLCYNLGYHRVLLGSNSMRAIEIIRRADVEPWYCSNIVAEIRLTMGKLEEFEFFHIFRETNSAADWLASLSIRAPEGSQAFLPPLCNSLAYITKEDREGKLYVRFC